MNPRLGQSLERTENLQLAVIASLRRIGAECVAFQLAAHDLGHLHADLAGQQPRLVGVGAGMNRGDIGDGQNVRRPERLGRQGQQERAVHAAGKRDSHAAMRAQNLLAGLDLGQQVGVKLAEGLEFSDQCRVHNDSVPPLPRFTP